MCGSSGDSDRAAREAREREEKRQRNIAAETSRINKTFEQYGDGYFDNVASAYMDHYTPQMQDQFEDARRATIYGMPGGGMGSAYSNAFGRLAKEGSQQEVALRQGGQTFANNLRSKVEQGRGQLISQAELAGGTGSAAERAVALSKTLATPEKYEPLGDLFARYTNTVAQAQRAKAAGFDVPSSSILFTGPSRGSVSYVT